MKQAGRIVIITGAAGGIGRALVSILAGDGDTVVAVDLPGRGVVELARDCGHPHLGLECDVSREEEVRALYGRLQAQFAQLDVLINNAAVGPTMTATVDSGVDAFRRGLAVNLVGPLLMSREAARRMGPGSAIVNIASIAGIISNPKRNAYAASKAGLISLTKSLACEWASRGVRVTAVAPGCVHTPMIAALERARKMDPAAMRRRVPMGRMARADEIARVARFLASPQASYITGSVLAVDGGWMTFNQAGDAHAAVEGAPRNELSCKAEPTDSRIVVVTGGANGAGAAIVRRFTANGDTVVIADRDYAAATALPGSLGGRSLAQSVDVALESEVVALFNDLRGRFGRIDVLVNCAAVAEAFSSGIEETPVGIEHVLDVNITGAFTCAREAIKVMCPGSVILNLASIDCFLPFAPRHIYGASRAAMDMLSRCMAAELGPVGIRTATVAPGCIRTPAIDQLARAGRIDLNLIARRIPMGRMGRPEEVADAVFFLASSDASYISGSTLYVDGGWTSFGDAGDTGGLPDHGFAEAAG
ncbi:MULTISPECIES: SDR family oxidoreductase [Mesorhizobium]|uniref:SDR family oxidoreductase n=1 Tax=Mesorhizobium neociceri TaxID=1307853 RepID=A0A838BCU6_9HYPH|nr:MULTISPECIES: SDR family oxidoreductase [Mesorhizobium]MBA1143859.1 SDR family oxidoreductase [Mesorhizobium neociceri]